MIGKIIAGSSFGATVGYVMKEQSRVLAAEERKRKLRQRKIKDHSMGL